MTHKERVATFRDQLQPGTRLTCRRNDRIPTRAGLRCIINGDVGVWSFPVTVEVDPADRMDSGTHYWLSFPKRAGDLIEATTDKIVYRLENGGEIVEWGIER